MMTTLLLWQARAAGEMRRMVPWKRSIHSMMSEEPSCSDSAACVRGCSVGDPVRACVGGVYAGIRW